MKGVNDFLDRAKWHFVEVYGEKENSDFKRKRGERERMRITEREFGKALTAEKIKIYIHWKQVKVY